MIAKNSEIYGQPLQNPSSPITERMDKFAMEVVNEVETRYYQACGLNI